MRCVMVSRILILFAGLTLGPLSRAASIDTGQALYTANCVGCHGTPPNGLKIDNLVAANRPDLIRNQIQTNPAMRILAALTDVDLADIAAYLANPTSSDADCVFGWGEVILPALLAPRTISEKANGFDYRYYPPANVYVGIRVAAPDKLRHLYFLDAKTGNGLVDLGAIGSFLDSALTAGCP